MHVYKDCVLVLLQNQLAEVKENSLEPVKKKMMDRFAIFRTKTLACVDNNYYAYYRTGRQ